MRSPALISTRMHLLFAVLFTINLPYANPVAPMPITKACYLDSLHWTIEFNAEELGFYNKIPDQTDMITLGCAKNTSSNIPMQQCAMPIYLNTDSGSGLIAPQHFPGLKLKPGWTIFIGVKDDDYSNQGPTLPENLQPNTIIELNVTKSTCYDYIGGETAYSYSCTKREYVTTSTECPSYTRGNGRINGVLTDKRKIPLSSFNVFCFSDLRRPPIVSVQTSGNGSFVLGSLDPCPSHILQFRYNNYQIDYTVGPLNSEQQQTLDLSIQLEYPPTGSNEQPTLPAKRSPAVRMLASSGSNGNPIVLAVSDNSLQGKGTCELYALSGEIIRSLSFACLGIGTYTIAWEGTDGKGRQVPAATYLCRITIGPEIVCRSFITR
jgi:hypothetical protein